MTYSFCILNVNSFKEEYNKIGGMMKNIKAIFLDIDGTMTDTKGFISSSLINILKELEKRNIRIIITTGRNFLYTKDIAKKIGIKDIIITNNGAVVYDLEKNKLIMNKTLRKVDVLKIYKYCSEHNCKLVAHSLTSNIEVINKDDIPSKVTSVTITSNNYERMQIVESLFLDTIPNVKIVNSSKSLVNKKYNKDEIYFHDIASFYVSKGNGILEAQEYLGITKNNSLCVGDSNNDISMTYVCEYSYAMGNSTKDLKDSVKKVIKGNDDDGLYLFLKDYLDKYLSLN